MKRRAVEEYGGQVIPCEPTLAARETTAAEVLAQTGGVLIPPYDHPDVIAGQGTAALELLDQVSAGLDALVAPIGGGGLMAGMTIAAKGLRPEAAPLRRGTSRRGRRSPVEGGREADSANRTAHHRRRSSDQPGRVDLADPARPGRESHYRLRKGDRRHHAAPVERAKLLVEPSAAVAVAAVLSQEFQGLGGLNRVGIVLSGGNVNLDDLPW